MALGQVGAGLGWPPGHLPWAWMPSRPQDSQCGTVIDVNIDCAVKLIGTNCIVYPVNSKDLQHIWVSPLPASPHGALLLSAASSRSSGQAQCSASPCSLWRFSRVSHPDLRSGGALCLWQTRLVSFLF